MPFSMRYLTVWIMRKKEEEESIQPLLLRDKGMVSAIKLLEREPDPVYLEEWTELLARGKAEGEGTAESSAVVFALGGEWLALSTGVFSEVGLPRPVHKIPHRSNEILEGVVNVRGQLLLSVNLHNLLEIPHNSDVPVRFKTLRRMLGIQKSQDRWVFLVDELFGIVQRKEELLENVPVTVAKSTANYLKGVFTWNGRSVGLLDDELLFYSLRKKAL